MNEIVKKLQDSLEYEFNLSFSERKQLLELIEKKDKEILQLNLDKNELMKTGFECCDKVRDLYKSRIDKAIEYINKNIELNVGALSNREELIVSKHDLIKNETALLNCLLNILKGSDKE